MIAGGVIGTGLLGAGALVLKQRKDKDREGSNSSGEFIFMGDRVLNKVNGEYQEVKGSKREKALRDRNLAQKEGRTKSINVKSTIKKGLGSIGYGYWDA